MSDEWFAAPAIVKLNQEIQARWPGRDTTSDGVLGDSSHQARKSDHNPAWDEPEPFTGIVRATDRDVDRWPAYEVRDFIISRCRSGAEKRLWYVINDRTIWSHTYGWMPRPYDGDNPHTGHIHFSLMHDMSNFDDSPWLDSFGGDEDDMSAKAEEQIEEIHAWAKTMATNREGKYAVAQGQLTVGESGPVMVGEIQNTRNDLNAVKGQLAEQSAKIDAQAAQLAEILTLLKAG